MATPRSIRPEERHNREDINNQERENTREDAEEYVEADQPESEEDRLVRQGVTDIKHGQREKVIVHDIRNTSRTLY